MSRACAAGAARRREAVRKAGTWGSTRRRKVGVGEWRKKGRAVGREAKGFMGVK